MNKNIFGLRRVGCLALILVAVLFFGATNSFALPLTGVKITANGTPYNGGLGNWYTQYMFDANEIDGSVHAFCVDATPGVQNPPEGSYFLASATGVDNRAVQLASEFFSGNLRKHNDITATKRDYQIAIWGIVINGFNIGTSDIISDLFKHQSGYSTVISLAESVGYQDYLINAPVPEPGTMLLLGLGLIGLGITGRKKFFKK